MPSRQWAGRFRQRGLTKPEYLRRCTARFRTAQTICILEPAPRHTHFFPVNPFEALAGSATGIVAPAKRQAIREEPMHQTKHIIAIGATIFLALASAASFAEARPGGGHGFGGGHSFGGGHAFGGHSFGGHAFSARSFGGVAHHNFATHAGRSLHAYRSPAGHAHHLTNHAQHFAHAGNQHQLASPHQLANQHQLATHNQIANQHFQNGPVHHNGLDNGLAQNRLVHNNLVHNAMGGRQQIAHNQFWGRQFGAHHFHHGHGFFWAGPVFWPFAFGDIFSFALWPYYDPFWDYGPDWLYASVFWPYDEDDYDCSLLQLWRHLHWFAARTSQLRREFCGRDRDLRWCSSRPGWPANGPPRQDASTYFRPASCL